MPSPAFKAFYGLYRELAKVGVSVTEAKTMEVWEAAASLGIGSAPDEAMAAAGQVPQSSRALLHARLAASRGEGPPPQASATNPEEAAAMMAMLAN